MRFSKFFLTAAAVSFAVAAIAQDAGQSSEAREKAELETVDQELEQAGFGQAPASDLAPTTPPRLIEAAQTGQETTPSQLEQEAQRQSGRGEPEPGAPAPPEPAAPTPEAAAPAPEAAAPAAARAQPAETPSPPPLTRAQIAEIERTAARGRLLIAIARAGIVATQDMLSRVSDPEGAGISGWIAESEGNAMKVTFYADAGEGAAAHRTVYRASVLGGRVVSRETFLGADRPPLTPVQARMAAARAAASGLEHRPCGGGQFNYLVVPPASATAPVDVYQMTAPSQRGHFPLGGHFRATVAADGAISGARGFSSRCLDLEAPATPAGQPPQPIGITHPMDPMPSEIHVFLSQLIGRPLLVATGEPVRIWLATPERIAEVRP